MMTDNDNDYYYGVHLAYEIPFNVLDCGGDQDKAQARDNLYKRLSSVVPEDKYERFSSKLGLFQLKDNFNYILSYEAFFRITSGLPMEEYINAEQLKEKSQEEIENFLSSLDCDFKSIKIKALL